MTDKKKLIIGSRGSKLSLAYSNHVKSLLIKSNSQFNYNLVEIKVIKTSGDIFQNKRISDIGGKGVFCKKIEEELLDYYIHIRNLQRRIRNKKTLRRRKKMKSQQLLALSKQKHEIIIYVNF